jgi:uncharacterized repeat protein (TIGR03803 family)
MIKRDFSKRFAFLAFALSSTLMFPSSESFAAQKILVKFNSTTGFGVSPFAGPLVLDDAGNIFGVGFGGGMAYPCNLNNGCGTVYEVSPTGTGQWKPILLYSFQGGSDGLFPTSLIRDSAGNLYGTTLYGGGSANCTDGCGTVFKLSPTQSGTWQETIIYRFTGSNGSQPDGLAFDATGALFGTTANGGISTNSICGTGGCGTIFKITPKSVGPWTRTAIHVLKGPPTDGSHAGGLTLSSSGSFLGATSSGGTSNQGTVFRLSPTANGWSYKVIYSFDLASEAPSTDFFPTGGVIQDSAGNIYGPSQGGPVDAGSLYELSPTSGSTWTNQDIHDFDGGKNYIEAQSTLILDKEGNLWGTTYNGGGSTSCTQGCGTLFELTPASGGGWTFRQLLVFNTKNGYRPSGLVMDNAGHFYGTALGGGTKYGLIYEYTP